MIISFYNAISICAIIILLGMFIGFLITKKRNQKPIGGIIFGFTPGMAISLAVAFTCVNFYLVSEPGKVKQYLFWGNVDFETDKGSHVELKYCYNNSFVFNDSESYLMIESRKYGGYGLNFGNGKIIEPGQLKSVPASKIHYFFDDSPPKEIQVENGKMSETRYWVHQTDPPVPEYDGPTIKI